MKCTIRSMGKYVIAILLFVFQFNARAQVTSIDWIQLFSGNNSFLKIEIDDEDNIYAGINFDDRMELKTMNFKGYPDANYIAPHNKAAVIVKMNKQGKMLWHKYIGQFHMADFTLNKAKEVIISGDAFFPGSPYTPIDLKSPIQKRGTYLLKINRQTELEVLYRAEHEYQNPEGPYGLVVPVLFRAGSVVVKSNNEIYWANIFMEKDETETAGIALLDASGRNIKKHFFKHRPINSSIAVNNKLAIDKEDNLYVCGRYQRELRTDGRVDFVNDYIAGEEYDGEDSYIMKFDKQQQLSWKVKVGGRGPQYISSIAVKDSLLYIAGNFSNAGCFISNGDVQLSSEERKIQGGHNSFLLTLSTGGAIEQVDYYQSHNTGENEGLASFLIQAAEPLPGNQLLISGRFIKDILYNGHRIEYPIKTNYNMSQYGYYGLVDGGEVKALSRFGGIETSPTQIKVSGDMVIMAGIFLEQPGVGIEYERGFKEFDPEAGNISGCHGFIMSVKLDPSTYNTKARTKDTANFAAVIAAVDTGNKETGNTGAKSSLVRPNPSRGAVSLDLYHLAGEVQVSIYNAAGQMVFNYNKRMTNTEEHIGLDLSRLAPGAYFVYVTGGEYKQTHKVIKQ